MLTTTTKLRKSDLVNLANSQEDEEERGESEVLLSYGPKEFEVLS